MTRSFGLRTLTGSAQPLFGDKITAAFVNIKDNQGWYYLKVADSSIYQVGDRWIIGVGSGNPTNCIMIQKIVDATTLAIASEGDAPLRAWALNTVLMLDIACAQIVFYNKTGNAGAIWLGTDTTVTNVGGGTAFQEVTLGSNFPLGVAQWNTLRTSEYFMAGQANDKAGIAAIII